MGGRAWLGSIAQGITTANSTAQRRPWLSVLVIDVGSGGRATVAGWATGVLAVTVVFLDRKRRQ